MPRYRLIACHVLWREFCHVAAQAPHPIDIAFLEQGLHNTPQHLQTALQEAIDAAEGGNYDAVLLGYGLCSNGLAGLRARATRVVLVRAHDCITFLLGSKERYRAYFDANPGTYWYSPGWIDDTLMPGKERYEQARQRYAAQYGEENAQYLMDMEQPWFTHYNNAAYVDAGIGRSDGYRAFTQECADWLGWRCDALEGSPRLFEDLVAGRWDADAFLVLEPGQRVVPSYDEHIIKAEATGDGERNGG